MTIPSRREKSLGESLHELIVLCMEIERETNPAEYERLIEWNRQLRKKRLQKERQEKLKKMRENNL